MSGLRLFHNPEKHNDLNEQSLQSGICCSNAPFG
jgi:hypothetical protein